MGGTDSLGASLVINSVAAISIYPPFVTGVLVTLGVFVAIYALLLVGIALLSLYPPKIPITIHPQQLGIATEDFEVSIPRANLKGWFLVPKDSSGVVLFCHGYLMNRLELLAAAIDFYSSGYAVALFDFGHHGQSSGGQVTVGVEEWRDVQAVVGKIRNRFPGERLVIYGSSMGAASATFAAAKSEDFCDGLILDSPYRCLGDASTRWWTFMAGKLGFLCFPASAIAVFISRTRPRDARVDLALNALPNIPCLTLVGSRDPILPEAEAKAFENGTNHRLLIFSGSNHCAARVDHPEEFRSAIRTFVAKVMAGVPVPSEKHR